MHALIIVGEIGVNDINYRLRKLHPHVTILYADYYNAVLRIFQEPARFGGPYNYNIVTQCGTKGVDCCHYNIDCMLRRL
ncbi:unnamed protein product [Microthlaspi erraticum]|uniref:Uncharacterized protein n=1 Tax=Microthlaspi erraticum TaxID=1685480 RepID=A0A6D2HMD2_9BRAS|nr:unnamed protein product [Microthlaspi erraticum]